MSHMLRTNRCLWKLWINVEMKDKIMDPSIRKKTSFKSPMCLMFCVGVINECLITMFSPCGTWSSLAQFAGLLKRKHILQEVCYPAETSFFFFLTGVLHPPLHFFLGLGCFPFSLNAGTAEASTVKREQSGNQSRGHLFILLAPLGMMRLANNPWHPMLHNEWGARKIYTQNQNAWKLSR